VGTKVKDGSHVRALTEKEDNDNRFRKTVSARSIFEGFRKQERIPCYQVA
jgi:hypothetical protein